MPEQDQTTLPESSALIIEKISAMLRAGTDATLQVASDRTEAQAWALVETFDSRLTEAEKRIERVLARLGAE